MTEARFEDYTDSIKDIVDKACSNVLSNKTYDPNQANKWIKQINEQILKDCKNQKFPFKVIVSGYILQYGGAGFNSATNFYWTPGEDGKLLYKYEPEDPKQMGMYPFFYVFGITE